MADHTRSTAARVTTIISLATTISKMTSRNLCLTHWQRPNIYMWSIHIFQDTTRNNHWMAARTKTIEYISWDHAYIFSLSRYVQRIINQYDQPLLLAAIRIQARINVSLLKTHRRVRNGAKVTLVDLSSALSLPHYNFGSLGISTSLAQAPSISMCTPHRTPEKSSIFTSTHSHCIIGL